ncbi:hypothetical protein QEZ54_27400 [Catellatospora sp. KI3]|uniref:hypothetical protein n=1 Tax=Catellatospora sp. KI3 TaxID=3041620 RepID=UPI00248268E3|nr:hypothetical protein [Catellatospora sp. KI3]MDI1464703.1 hypothetical protein [Catellatospora sp. KI3]
MTLSVAVQIAVAIVWLGLYLVLSVRYQRSWDARMRAALGRRLGTGVGWAQSNGSGDPFTDDTTAGAPVWRAEGTGSLGQQLWQHGVARAAQLAVMVGLGVLPAAALLGVEFLLHFHGLVVLGTALAVIAIFSLFWVGTYRRS